MDLISIDLASDERFRESGPKVECLLDECCEDNLRYSASKRIGGSRESAEDIDCDDGVTLPVAVLQGGPVDIHSRCLEPAHA